MPVYLKLGEVPRKRHIKMPRDPRESFRGEGIAYEHVITTQGFDRAYSIMYHLRPPTRVKKVETAGQVELKPADGQVLRHHHLKTFEMPRAGSPITPSDTRPGPIGVRRSRRAREEAVRTTPSPTFHGTPAITSN